MSRKLSLFFEYGPYIFWVTDHPNINIIIDIEKKRKCKFIKKIKEPDFFVFIFFKNVYIYLETEKTHKEATLKILKKDGENIMIEYSNVKYYIPIKIFFFYLYYIYNNKKVDITSFNKFLQNKNICVDITDKRKQNDYICFWFIPNKICKMFIESEKIGTIIHKDKTSERRLELKENIDFIKLWNKFLEWINKYVV